MSSEKLKNFSVTSASHSRQCAAEFALRTSRKQLESAGKRDFADKPKSCRPSAGLISAKSDFFGVVGCGQPVFVSPLKRICW